MPTLSRRRFLAGLGGSGMVAVAGCADDDDPEPGLHATTATVLHRPGDDRYQYPEDVAVRVVVENTDLDRHTGTLVVGLERVSDSGETSGDAWTTERPLDLSGGTTRSYVVVFEGVAESTATTFEATAHVEPAD